MEKELYERKTIDPVDLPDGEYVATWSGHIITIHTLDGDVEAQTSDAGIRGTMELDVEIENGIIYSEIL
jgi:hypothetical protein